jgi:hypothetical protein
MYGALECLVAAGESTLSPHAALVLSSQNGPIQAVRSAMAQACEDLPLPLSFLQTQPSQLLAALSAQLKWSGDARFVTHSDPLVLLAWALSLADSHADGLLLGWVDEIEAHTSVWLRLQPAPDPGGLWCLARDLPLLLQSASYVRPSPYGLEVIIGCQNDQTDQID